MSDFRFTVHKDSIEGEEILGSKGFRNALDCLPNLCDGMYQILDNKKGDVLTLVVWDGGLYEIAEKQGINIEYINKYMNLDD
jgi:hypothetical protein